MDNDLVKRLAWSGLLAAFGALATMVSARLAAVVYQRIFGILPLGDEELEEAKAFVVETICGGLEAAAPSAI